MFTKSSRFFFYRLQNQQLFNQYKMKTALHRYLCCTKCSNFDNNIQILLQKRCYCDTLHLNTVDFDKQTIKNDKGVNSYSIRTHNCGQLRTEHVGQTVVLCGWVEYIRMSKFLILRDAYGITQCIIINRNLDLSNISLESVLLVQGKVVSRPKKEINSNLSTGEIEVEITAFDILNTAENLPFNLRSYQKPKEQLRLQHRYIDLRFPEMQNNLRQRSLMLHNMRKFLVENKKFVEVETPTLFCRTPGGAREFVVPTHHSGLFYSLVQSPQQFKQMLMAGGIDRYFQVARCYRDESTRPDRQPEFTQLDIELSFTNMNGVLNLIEDLLFETCIKPIQNPPFERMTYKEAMENYGSDKPDIGHGLKFKDITHLFSDNSYKGNFAAYALPYPVSVGKLTAKLKETVRDIRKRYVNTKVSLSENISKEFGENISSQLVGENDATIIAVGDKGESCSCLGEIRLLLVSLLKSKGMLQEENVLKPLWIVDFPLFIEGENDQLETCHHPFTAPHPDDLTFLDTDPLKVRSLAYDIVINGNEIGGGSVRVHNAEIQEKLLKILNINANKLSHFMNALKSGCPPHAGIALGIDRLVALGCNAESIRDVIAFPKSHDGKDPLSGAPNPISNEDKKYYHISLYNKDIV